MRILHLSAYDLLGGAGLAAHRLHLGLRAAGVDSRVVVRRKYGTDPHVAGPRRFGEWLSSRLRRRREIRIALKAGWGGQARFTPGCSGRPIGDLVRQVGPDIVHVHWIGDGFVDVSSLSGIPLPIVWTLHDSWPFTGGCHFPGGCRRFQGACGACPLLGSYDSEDLSRRMIERKRRAYVPCRLAVVAPSEWLAEMAGTSQLFADKDIRCIRNGLSLESFSSRDRSDARVRLGVYPTDRLILAGASGFRDDPRKGFDLFSEIAARLSQHGNHRIRFASFGGSDPGVYEIGGVTVRELGTLKAGTEMASTFAAADLFVVASREDNLPNTVCESLACGTPVAGFAIGGIPEMIEDDVNGCLAPGFDVESLSSRMEDLLADENGAVGRRLEARKSAERLFSISTCVEGYLKLYSELTSPS